MNGGSVFVDGIAFWSPVLPGWPEARAAFRGEGPLAHPPRPRPAPELLAPAERRRAPDTVALALEVALRAVEASGHRGADLPSVFSSTHGDLAITDAMCRTLASAPRQMSPTRFHNSVHNAPAGYWTLATGCMQASSALSAAEGSFAAGLLEALAQCTADERAALLVAYDIEACGALASTAVSRGLLATALVIAPRAGTRSLARLVWSLQPGVGTAAAPRSAAAQALAGNAMAPCLPLFEALACGGHEPVLLPLSSSLSLRVELVPASATDPAAGRALAPAH
jgi:Beta-ketoacyl synthase, N-terminal domain